MQNEGSSQMNLWGFLNKNIWAIIGLAVVAIGAVCCIATMIISATTTTPMP